MVSPSYLELVQPLFPKWYNENAQCEYHVRITGHSIKNCTTFKKLFERFMKMRIAKLPAGRWSVYAFGVEGYASESECEVGGQG